jgi:hypothetical protein
MTTATMTGKDERRAAMTTDERAMTATSNDNPAKTEMTIGKLTKRQ